MRKPQHPPSIEDIIASRREQLIPAFTDERYRQFARRCEGRYWHWDKIRFVARSSDVDPEIAWAIVKIGRAQQERELPLLGHNSVNLRYTLPDLAQRELMLIDQQLAGRVSADTERPFPTGQRERFVISALQEEAIASSMLEGAATTRKDAKRMLRSGRRPKSQGERMVANNYRTILFIRETRDIDLSSEYLLEIQGLLTNDSLDDPDHVGRYRTEADDIKVVDTRDNEIMHVPPSAGELQHRIDMLCTFANAPLNGEPFVHPVVKAIILHFQLAFDHPFCDGNGRTARAIFYWYLLRHGYWLFEFLPISPLFVESAAKYSRAYLYTETDSYDVTYFLMYNLSLIARARKGFWNYVRKKQTQVAQAHRVFKADPLLNRRQQELLLRVARNPDWVFSIAEHQHEQGIAYGTARSDLLYLAVRRYLERNSTGNKYTFVQGPRLRKLVAATGLGEPE